MYAILDKAKPNTGNKSSLNLAAAICTTVQVSNCTHVILRQDATRWALEPPSAYQVLSQRAKTLHLLVRRKPVTVPTDRVKPAYVLNEADVGAPFSPPGPAQPPPLSNLPPRGGGVMCESVTHTHTSHSHLAADGQSVSTSWCRAHFGTSDQSLLL
jgi:hypothetical protein